LFFKESVMSKFMSLSQITVAAAVAMSLAASLALLAEPAQARERAATWSGPNGKTATRNAQRAGGDVSSATTGANSTTAGKTMSRDVDRSAEGAQATVTGPNGQTAIRSTAYRGSGDSATTVTGAKGKTATRVTQRSPQGGTSNTTGPNGQTVTREVTRQP
jgi:hypothetical protein